MRDVTLYSMKKKIVHNCRFVHHAKFHCIMTMLYKLIKIDFDRGELEKSRVDKSALNIKRRALVTKFRKFKCRWLSIFQFVSFHNFTK